MYSAQYVLPYFIWRKRVNEIISIIGHFYDSILRREVSIGYSDEIGVYCNKNSKESRVIINPILTTDEITSELERLQDDSSMTTKSIYSPTATEYVDNQLPFVQTHLKYLQKNKHINAYQYICNLKIMIKKR